MTRPSSRRPGFVERVLDGDARLDQLEAEVEAWQRDEPDVPLGGRLGLSADELDQVAGTPDALRYVLRARRFGLEPVVGLRTQGRVVAHAARIASECWDPFELAEVDAWRAGLADRSEEPVGA